MRKIIWVASIFSILFFIEGAYAHNVPAGKFVTQHFQFRHYGSLVDSWVYKNISPYGLIKSQAKDFEMALTGYGTGGRSLVTEKPQKFEMPQMGKERPKSKASNKEEDDDGDNGNNDNDNNDDEG